MHGASGGISAPAPAGMVHTYCLPIQRDTALEFHISSRDLFARGEYIPLATMRLLGEWPVALLTNG